MNKELNTQKKCSQIIEGLQFCTTTPTISIKSGENIFIVVSLQNMSDETIPVTNGILYNSYDVLITDSKGEKVLSDFEDLAKEVAEKKISKDKLQLPLYAGRPRIELLAPQQELKSRLGVSGFYNLIEKGKYFIKLVRKVPKNDWKNFIDLPLDPIELEIK